MLSTTPNLQGFKANLILVCLLLLSGCNGNTCTVVRKANFNNDLLLLYDQDCLTKLELAQLSYLGIADLFPDGVLTVAYVDLETRLQADASKGIEQKCKNDICVVVSKIDVSNEYIFF